LSRVESRGFRLRQGFGATSEGCKSAPTDVGGYENWDASRGVGVHLKSGRIKVNQGGFVHWRTARRGLRALSIKLPMTVLEVIASLGFPKESGGDQDFGKNMLHGVVGLLYFAPAFITEAELLVRPLTENCSFYGWTTHTNSIEGL
jgi:hypothetical protein